MKSRDGRRTGARNFKLERDKGRNTGISAAKTARSSMPEGLFIVEGIAAVREYLRHKPKSVRKVFAKERAFKTVQEQLQEFDISIQKVSETHEQGSMQPTPVWAHVQHEMQDWMSFVSELDHLTDEESSLVLVLDHISDPRNLGAIVRSAAFFGVRHVIVPERRQVLLTQSSVNTAQGGFALTELVVVVNVARAIEELKSKDFWVLGAAMDGEAVGSVRGRYKRQVLVLGSEDKGISQSVLKKCDVIVSIPGGSNSLDSLNVSVAAGILVHELKGKP